MATFRIRSTLWGIAGIAWAGVISLGLWIMADYENAPGHPGAPPPEWPHDSRIERGTGRHTLVMLAHPHCPCTRASIGQLALIMARCRETLDAHVVFVRPEGFAEEWSQTDLWRSAAMTPNVTVLDDPRGVEARRFGSVVSGQTLLYAPDGQLVFAGGITASRGHAGDNLGRSAVVSLVHNGTADQNNTFVFGCNLLDPCAEEAQ